MITCRCYSLTSERMCGALYPPGEHLAPSGVTLHRLRGGGDGKVVIKTQSAKQMEIGGEKDRMKGNKKKIKT